MYTLAEEILMLSIDDQKGSFINARSIDQKLGGAILTELALSGNLGIEGPKPYPELKRGMFLGLDSQTKLVVVNDTPVGDDILDEALALTGQTTPTKENVGWIGNLLRTMAIVQRLSNRLIDKGILRREEHRTWGIFLSDRYWFLDHTHKQSLLDQLRAVIFDGATPDRRTAVLLLLVECCRLTDAILPTSNSRQERNVKLEMYLKRFSELFPMWYMDKEMIKGIDQTTCEVLSNVLVETLGGYRELGVFD